MAIAVSDWGIESAASGSRRWSVCFGAILALHVAGLWLAFAFWHEAAPLQAGSPPIAMIELAPLPVAPPVVAPAPPEPVTPPPLEETAPPSPAPIIAAPLPPKPKPMKRPPPREAPPQITAAPAPAEALPTPAQAAPAESAPRPSNVVPSWQSALLARLEQFKRYPNLAQFRHQQGVAQLRFTMDRQGHVLSAQIAKSSGYDALDDETLALIHRAEPLPPPPAEMPGATLALIVPVQFSLK